MDHHTEPHWAISTIRWLLGSVVLFGAIFVPVPRVWPPEGIATFQPDASQLPLAIAAVLALLVFILTQRLVFPRGRLETSRLGWCVALLVVQTVLLRATIEVRPLVLAQTEFAIPEPMVLLPWIIPVGLATILFGVRQGFIVALFTAIVPWLVPQTGASPILSAGLLLSAIVAVLGLRRCPRRWHVISGGTRAGLLFGLIAALDVALMSPEPIDLGVALAGPLVMGAVGSLVLLVLLPFAEWITGRLSDSTLIELGSHHPVLDLLRSEAPGTWNHSINVADLAESAARAIGANDLFCRTASLYHDIGKMRDPQFFAENQRGASPHDGLAPHKSAAKIIEHVTHGLELAHKHRVPAPIRAIIAEHHGTSLVGYFYARATDVVFNSLEREKLKEKFRYPGPRPHSIESGIISLADTVEAAARSAGQLEEPGIRDLVFKLIASRIQEGELNDCALTLDELAEVRESFVQTLVSRLHHRPAYPAQEATASRKGAPAKIRAARNHRSRAKQRV